MPKNSMQQLIDKQGLEVTRLRKGDVLEGEVVAIEDKQILVDVGAKSEGFLPLSEIKEQRVKPGDKVVVFVEMPEDREGQIRLSLEKAKEIKAWLDLEEIYKSQKPVEAVVTGHNKGGLIVEIYGQQAFIPFSHLEAGPQVNLPRPEFQSALDKMRGERISAQLIELNREKNRIILSEREFSERKRVKIRKTAIKVYKIGSKVEASIKAVLPYGLQLVLADEIEGIVPLEELYWEASEDILTKFTPEQKVKAKIIEIDEETGKIKLSIKQTQPDPWLKLAKSFKKGDLVQGEVSKIASFGILVRLNKGIEGFLSLSELDKDQKKSKKIAVGDRVKVEVQTIDTENHRLSVKLV